EGIFDSARSDAMSPEQPSPNPAEAVRKIVVQAPSGECFEAEVPCKTPLKELAADFYAAQGWPSVDRQGRGQRVVVELVNPDNPEDTNRLNGDMDLDKAGVVDGDLLRILPESIAGVVVDPQARMNALIADHADMQNLARQNPRITFTANRTH